MPPKFSDSKNPEVDGDVLPLGGAGILESGANSSVWPRESKPPALLLGGWASALPAADFLFLRLTPTFLTLTLWTASYSSWYNTQIPGDESPANQHSKGLPTWWAPSKLPRSRPLAVTMSSPQVHAASKTSQEQHRLWCRPAAWALLFNCSCCGWWEARAPGAASDEISAGPLAFRKVLS